MSTSPATSLVPARLAARLAMFGVAYYILAELGNYLAIKPANFATFWPPSGLFLATLLLNPTRTWPWFVAAAYPANIAFDLIHGRPLWVSLLFCTGNCLEALAGAWFTRRFISPRPSLTSLREVLGLSMVAALAATMLSASVGAATLVAAFGGDYASLWRVWWSADILGVLMVAPAILAWAARPRWARALRAGAALEGACLAAAIIAFVWVSSLGLFHADVQERYLVVPLFVWAALRFGIRGVASAGLLLTLCTAFGAPYSPCFFNAPDLSFVHKAFSLQLFLAVIMFTSLVLAAVLEEREAAKSEALAAKAEVLAAKEFSAGLLENIPASIYVVSILGKVLLVNRAWENFYGLAREDVVDKFLDEIVPAEDAERLRRVEVQTIESTLPVTFEELVCRHGEEYVFQTVKFPLFNPAGQVDRVASISLDITELKRAMDSLRKSENKFKSLYEQAADGILLVDMAETIYDANPAALEMLGYSAEELRGKHYSELITPASLKEQPLDFAGILNGRTVRRERVFFTRAGAELDVDVSVGLVGGANIQILFKDVSDRKTLERLHEDVERIIRHDLRSPLAGLMSGINLLLGERNLTAERSEVLALMRDSGHRMLKLLNMTLEIYKMETKTYALQASDFDLLKSLRKVLQEMGEMAGAAHISFRVFVDGAKVDPADSGGQAAAYPVRGEELLCFCLLENLIKNAVEAAPRGEEVCIELDSAARTVSIQNKGEVPLAIREKFFGKYVTAGKAHGTGLGAYSARLMAEVQGWSIRLDASRPGQTTIVVCV